LSRTGAAAFSVYEGGKYDIYVRILGKPGGHINICADTFEDFLSGESDATLYVFRDGRWARGMEPEWWQDPSVGHVTVATETGTAIDVDQTFLDLIGADRDWVVGRLYHDFVVPQARVAADVLYRTTLETGSVHSIARVIGPGGRGLTCEFRAVIESDRIEIAVRSAYLAQSPLQTN
jgi:hypothetical protein